MKKKKKEGDTKKKICRVALRKLMSYDFPGNIRELENIIERTCVFSERNILREKDIKFDHEFFGSEKRANNTQEQLR